MKLAIYSAAICLIYAVTCKPLTGYSAKTQRDVLVDQHEDLSREADSEENDEEDESPEGIRDPTCLPGWSQNGTNCYLFVDNLVTWDAARNGCQARDSDLVEITSQAEQAFLNSILSVHSVWIALSDTATEGIFVWATSVSNASFTNWGSSEPADSNSAWDCVYSYYFTVTWSAYFCDYLYDYICERQAESDFHDFCGNTIDNEAGELQFDAQKLPSRNECSVTVKPMSKLLTETTHVMFYFTKFDLSGPCEDLNVTVIEGPLLGRRLHVEGLPHYICGHNTSIEKDDQVFTTSSDQFTVTFNRKKFARYPIGQFSIKFIAFQTGECYSNGVVRCSTGRCIASEYSCSDDINACGEKQPYCSYPEKHDQEGYGVLAEIQIYILIVIAIIGLCVLQIIYRRKRQAISNMKESVCLRLRNLFSGSPGSRRQSDTSQSQSTEEHDVHLDESSADNILQRSEEVQPGYNSSNSSSRSLIYEQEPSDVYIDNDNVTSAVSNEWPTTPSAPPPSYDDVMAPSYDDVMANEHMYKCK